MLIHFSQAQYYYQQLYILASKENHSLFKPSPPKVIDHSSTSSYTRTVQVLCPYSVPAAVGGTDPREEVHFTSIDLCSDQLL